MKPIMSTIFGVLFFILAGSGAYFYTVQPSQARGGDAFFVELSPLILSIVDDRGMAQVISLVVSIEVDTSAKAEQVKKFAPRLTDAYLSDLYGTLGQRSVQSGKIIPITYLKDRLNKVSHKVMGDDIVSDVLLQVFQQRGA